MELTVENVNNTFRYLLFDDDEDKTNYVPVDGIHMKIGFHLGRLKEKTEDIHSLLLQLPYEFHRSKGGGWTFLNACLNKDLQEWTGLHVVMDELITMGLAIDKVFFLMPREKWEMLPGGMPYITVVDK